VGLVGGVRRHGDLVEPGRLMEHSTPESRIGHGATCLCLCCPTPSAFWFTERGWRAYGVRAAAEARASSRAFRVIRRKNPPKSMVVYRDDWQVALLPDRD
jgi:hypothetical protein